jgi:hypothetical protein
MRGRRWLTAFVKWWSKNGGNAQMSDLEAAYRAGWKAALRSRKLA